MPQLLGYIETSSSQTKGDKLGLCLEAHNYVPYSNSFEDKAAAKRAPDFELGFMEPLVHGDYPESIKQLARQRLPVLTAEEKKLVKGLFDFIGVSFNAIPKVNCLLFIVIVAVEKYGVPIGPKGLLIEDRDDSRMLDVALKDPHRIDFVVHHLYWIHKAVEEGVIVKGYFYWAPFDDPEWQEGFFGRFGLYYIDYKNNLTRIPKDSLNGSMLSSKR
ncbi:hypothetical protein Pint_15707 [Pistacia integerrima]|uniref:Uncharacterized protein n=1 Tax=Pistacia integerrima TaxID=434235 RepID=A0ACC0ZAP1_9ROSI|nr:hypothetical protein Pint_15707 [Pistacia integerrima]